MKKEKTFYFKIENKIYFIINKCLIFDKFQELIDQIANYVLNFINFI